MGVSFENSMDLIYTIVSTPVMTNGGDGLISIVDSVLIICLRPTILNVKSFSGISLR